MISEHFVGPWPKNVWAVDSQCTPFEAQLENAELGRYHGYPMPEGDPMRENILERWNQS
ncbi:hypothetical protein [Candidatus Magnetaquicoccus inordinatus]|uniref:hypothetical protein n=1 Tax=Candidatus Magnetaquicoccus inordinatus TaxID=2496818 RepID=UPI001D0F1C19|nr:hypothetical protein [Candidatus Magnetaquicoccus inordinatus]